MIHHLHPLLHIHLFWPAQMSRISQIYTRKLNPKFTLLKKNQNFVQKTLGKEDLVQI